MKVKSIMNREVATCRPDDALWTVARLLWDHDCGLIPVVHESGRLEGVVTDRDLCMAALLSNRPASTISIREVMAKELATCRETDDVRAVHAAMRDRQLHRVPVVDRKRNLVGLVCLNDLACEAFGSRSAAAQKRQREVARTLAEVSRHREL